MLTSLALASTLIMPTTTDRVWESLALKDGRELHYLTQLPETRHFPNTRSGHGDAEVTPRLLLALPPGGQDRTMVERSYELYFDEGARRNFVVVIPRKIGDRLFHEGDCEVLIELIDHIEGRFSTAGKPALAGISNGGRSAFRLALDHPERFSSLTVLPGMPPTQADFDRLDRLRDLPIAMFVGGEDRAWRERMESIVKVLPHATLDVIEGEGHTPPGLTGGMVFDAIPPLPPPSPTQGSVATDARSHGVRKVESVLDDFHDAASEADGTRYFDHFATDGVFLGTDATERWTVSEFRAYAEPYFSQGKGWTYVATERHVTLSEAGDTAWFDERLQNAKYGEVRGSGVLVFERGAWRIAQYNLAFPVPNELSDQFMALLRGEGE